MQSKQIVESREATAITKLAPSWVGHREATVFFNACPKLGCFKLQNKEAIAKTTLASRRMENRKCAERAGRLQEYYIHNSKVSSP